MRKRAGQSKRKRVPDVRHGPSRNGTRPMTTVIWPLSRRRMAHVVTSLALKLPASLAPSKTAYVSEAVDTKVVADCKLHGIVLPGDLAFPSTPETLS